MKTHTWIRILFGALLIGGCSATIAEVVPTASQDCETSADCHNHVTIHTTTYRFTDPSAPPMVTQREHTVKGKAAGASAEELLDIVPEQKVDQRNYEIEHHRKITDRTTIMEEEPSTKPADEKLEAQPQPSSDAPSPDTTSGGQTSGWLATLLYAFMGMLTRTG